MEIKLLKSFLTVIKYGSITYAAKELHISQPALTKQIQELEEEVGRQLLIRRKKKILLTETGSFLEQKAKRIVALADDTLNELQSHSTVIDGHISFGVTDPYAYTYLIDSLKTFHNQHRKVRLNYFSYDAVDLVRKVKDGELDYAIVTDQIDRSIFDYISLPISNNWGLAMHRNLVPKGASKITPQLALNYPLVYARQVANWKVLSEWLGYTIDKLNIMGNYNLANGLVNIITSKLAVGVVDEHVYQSIRNKDIAFLPFDPPLITPTYIIWSKSRITNKALEIFHSYMENNIQNLCQDSFMIIEQ